MTANYKGLTVISPDPSGAGGLLIHNAIKALADRAAKNNLTAVDPPSANDDSGDNYDVGSLWLTASTLYVCTDATLTSASWRSIASDSVEVIGLRLLSGAIPSVDWGDRQLIDSANDISIDWTAYQLFIAGNPVMQWGSGYLYDINTDLSLSWMARTAHDSDEIVSIDWDNRQLKIGGDESVDWALGHLVNGSSIIAVDWVSYLLNRIHSSTVVPSIDWQNCILFGADEFTVMSWDGGLGFFGVSPSGQTSNIAAPTGGVVIDAESRTVIASILNLLEGYGLMGEAL